MPPPGADYRSLRSFAISCVFAVPWGDWATAIGLMRSEYGIPSLRRLKASTSYGVIGNLCAVHILLGHSKIEKPVRYPGIDLEDVLAPARNIEIGTVGSSPLAAANFEGPGTKSMFPACFLGDGFGRRRTLG